MSANDDDNAMRKQIAQAFVQMEFYGNLNPMRKLIDQRIHGNVTDAEKIEFLKLMRDSIQDIANKQDRESLEPYYSIIKNIFDFVVKKDSLYFLNATISENERQLTLDEMTQSHNRSRKKLMLSFLFSKDTLIFDLISVIQANWEIKNSLTQYLEKLMPLLDDSIKDELKKIYLFDEYRYIRNADSHIRITNNIENNTVHLRNYNPKEKCITWEKTYSYEEITTLCNELMKWINAFIYAWQDVLNESYIQAIIRNYEAKNHEN